MEHKIDRFNWRSISRNRDIKTERKQGKKETKRIQLR